MINSVATLSSASSSTRLAAFLQFAGCFLGGTSWDTCVQNYKNALSKMPVSIPLIWHCHITR